MKTMLKISAVLAALMLITGCTSSVSDTVPEKTSAATLISSEAETQSESLNDSSVIPIAEMPKNNPVTIYNEQNENLGEIRLNGVATVTEQGIFYPAVQEDKDPSITEYHLYDPDTKKDWIIGEMQDVAYEASYARCELDGCMYMLVMTGVLTDNVPDRLFLVKADLKKHMWSQYIITDDGFPYTMMAVAKNTVMIAWHDQKEVLTDRVIEFDPGTETLREVMTCTLDKQEIGESLRGLYSDGEELYMLRLKFEQDDTKLFIDTFDLSGRKFAEDLSKSKIAETDISSVVRKAAVENHVPEAEAVTELQMPVSRFLVREKCFYFENFSVTRCIANIETKELILAADDLFNASFGSGWTFFFRIMKNGDIGSSVPDKLYDLNWNELRENEFSAFDPAYYLVSCSSAPNGTRLLILEKREETESHMIMYYLKLYPVE